jgi:hypothetical protein
LKIDEAASTLSIRADRRNAVDANLPPDGTPIRIGAWRVKVIWAGTVVVGLIALSVLIEAIQIHNFMALLSAAAAMLALVVFVRMPLSGVIFEKRGVKARTVWRTYRWRWYEIESFELREKGEKPRFRVRLRNGQTMGFVGFFTQTDAEEKEGQALFRAVQTRLEAEHAKDS